MRASEILAHRSAILSKKFILLQLTPVHGAVHGETADGPVPGGGEGDSLLLQRFVESVWRSEAALLLMMGRAWGRGGGGGGGGLLQAFEPAARD